VKDNTWSGNKRYETLGEATEADGDVKTIKMLIQQKAPLNLRAVNLMKPRGQKNKGWHVFRAGEKGKNKKKNGLFRDWIGVVE